MRYSDKHSETNIKTIYTLKLTLLQILYYTRKIILSSLQIKYLKKLPSQKLKKLNNLTNKKILSKMKYSDKYSKTKMRTIYNLSITLAIY